MSLDTISLTIPSNIASESSKSTNSGQISLSIEDLQTQIQIEIQPQIQAEPAVYEAIPVVKQEPQEPNVDVPTKTIDTPTVKERVEVQQTNRKVSQENITKEENPHIESETKKMTKPIDIPLILFEEDLDARESTTIVMVKIEDKVFFGKQNTESDTASGEEQTDPSMPRPISTFREFLATFDFVDKENSDLSQEEDATNEKKEMPEVFIVVSDEILELMALIKEESNLQPDEHLEKKGSKDKKGVTLITSGEDKRELALEREQFSQMREFLIALEIVSGEDINGEDTTEIGGKPIKIENRGEVIIIGAQSKKTETGNAEEPEEMPEINDITTVGELSLSINSIDDFISNRIVNEKPRTAGANPKDKFILPFEEVLFDNFGSIDKNKETQTEEHKPQFKILASEELITFIDAGKKLFEEKEDDKTDSPNADYRDGKSEEKCFVTISSAQREVIVELSTLKKLVKLVEKKKEINTVKSVKRIEQTPEEVKQTVNPIKSGTDVPILFIYQTVTFLLVLAENSFISEDIPGLGVYEERLSLAAII